MSKFKKAIVLALTAVMAAGSIVSYSNAAPAEGKMNGEAGIGFSEGETVIDPNPGPDPDLTDIRNSSIYFGKQELSAETQTYNSVTTHEEEALKYAGFIVKAGNKHGWTLRAQITGFQMESENTMKNFTLKLKPGEPQTTEGNLGGVPKAYEVTLAGSNNKDVMGESMTIFEAETGNGLGKWGCNWEGDLTVIGGSVEDAGNASATMLLTLIPGNIAI